MIRPARSLLLLGGMAILAAACASHAPTALLEQTARYDESIELPDPDTAGQMTLEAAISARRSQRGFAQRALSTAELGQLLWAAQGITDSAGHRAAPSAGALYPLELYVVTADSVAHYLPSGHRLEARGSPDLRSDVADAAFAQEFVGKAPAVIVVTMVPSRTETKYGALGEGYAMLEAGHATQNLLLQVAALDLAATSVGGVDPSQLQDLLALPPDHEPVYVIPVGQPDEPG
jgi:SagB-type dehydrogenase family enzyme